MTVSTAEDHKITVISVTEIEALSLRLFIRGISTISTYSTSEKRDLVTASRVLCALLRRYERSVGRQLDRLMIDAGV